MEPADLIPSKSSSSLLKGHEAASAEEEPTDSPASPSGLRQPSPPIKSGTHQPSCNLHLPVEQSQPTFSMNSGSGWNERDAEHQDLRAESFVHLKNDHRGADTRLPRAEMGFADFTVFTEQTVHHWCCGFTPSGNLENFDSALEQRNSSNSPTGCAYNPGQGGFGDSELSPRLAEAKEKGDTIVRRWREGDAAVVQPSQDQQQPQETAATLVLPLRKPYFKKEEPDQNVLTRGGNSHETSDVQEGGSEQSAGGEEPGNWGTVKSAQPKTEEDLQHLVSSETQENSATSSQLQSGTHSQDDNSEARRGLESQRDPASAQTADEAALVLGTLPPSDSFADFCAAPVQDDEEDLWVEFTELKEHGGQRAWTRERAGQVPAQEEDKVG